MDLWLLFAVMESAALSLIYWYLLPNNMTESSGKASEALIEGVHTVGSRSLKARDELE